MDVITMPTIDSAVLVRVARRGDRFQTVKGALSFEELFDCRLTELDKAYADYAGRVEASSTKSLAGNKAPSLVDEDAVTILTFVYKTKEAEAALAAQAKEQKARDQKILAIIDSKENEALAGKSLDELRALLSGK